jgi:hypothetical protein
MELYVSEKWGDAGLLVQTACVDIIAVTEHSPRWHTYFYKIIAYIKLSMNK